MEPVEEAHDLQIVSRHRPWQIVHAATTDAQGLRLLRDGQLMLAHDHRLALSKPALPSATSKKSFSSVSSPILAWSDFTQFPSRCRTIAGLSGFFTLSQCPDRPDW